MNYTLKNNHASPRNVKTGGGGLWKKISFLMLCLLVTVQITAQHRPVSGAVIDGNGEPIIGANVIEVGTSNGVITDINGNYSLSVSSSNAKLQVSYIGYITQESTVKGSILNFTLKEDTQTLDEVVVVGFGTQKKVNLIWSSGYSHS